MRERLGVLFGLLCLGVAGHGVAGGAPASALAKPAVRYLVRLDSADRSGWEVELRVAGAPATLDLAMAAHPEYDDRYWRYLTDLRAETEGRPAAIVRRDSAVWRVEARRGHEVTIRYRLALPAVEGPPRAAWRPHRSSSGAYLGGPHTFLYVLGTERAPVQVTLDLPPTWRVATGLTATTDPRTFVAPSAEVLVDSPILVGDHRSWSFTVGGVPHRVVYWPLPDAPPFDTAAFLSGIEGFARQAVALFGGRMPYREYTFLVQDGAYGGLEHRNSVSLGAASADLAGNPHAVLAETAHEFFHTWNLMQIRPAEYRSLDYRTQPPVAGLWFSEGLTIFYADLLLRRAGLPVSDTTRVAHLDGILARYLASPGNARHSAEAVSRVAYNAPPGSLGDYSASTHLQGEVIGAMLDLVVRDATDGRRSMDDVMRLMLERFTGERGFEGRDVERTVEEVCRCDVSPLFEAHVRRGGDPIDVDRYLGLIGLRARVAWAPAVWNGQPERDLRIYGWEPPGEGGVRLVVTDPTSIWAEAGLHTGDPLASVDGAAVTTWRELRARLASLRLGDTIAVAVRRPAGPFRAVVVVTGFERPAVHLDETPATDRQRALRLAWMRGDP